MPIPLGIAASRTSPGGSISLLGGLDDSAWVGLRFEQRIRNRLSIGTDFGLTMDNGRIDHWVFGGIKLDW